MGWRKPPEGQRAGRWGQPCLSLPMSPSPAVGPASQHLGTHLALHAGTAAQTPPPRLDQAALPRAPGGP